MGHPARQPVDLLVAARHALERGHSAEGAAAIRQYVAERLDPAAFDQALHLAFEFNLVDLARELAREGASRYPRNAKLKRWSATLATPVVQSLSGSAACLRDRSEEAAWLTRHASQYRGRWVVLLGGELLAAGPNLKSAIRKVRGRLSEAPLVHFVKE